jgi:hypothetical protein
MMQATSRSQTETAKLISSAKAILKCTQQGGNNIPIRVFGSAAVAIRCPDNIDIWRKTSRKPVRDIDFVTLPQYREQVRRTLKNCGYSEVEGSMATNAQYRRLYFYQSDPEFLIEIHSAPLTFHHRIALEDDLTRDAETLTLADLAITKLQWGELWKNNFQAEAVRVRQEREAATKDPVQKHRFRVNELDGLLDLYTENTAQLLDLCVLFAEHPLTADYEPEGISVKRFLLVCGRDWGLWTTLRRNLKSLGSFVHRVFTQAELIETRDVILERLRTLRKELNNISDTSFKWNVDSVVRKVICERCVPIGYPVEEPRRDVWQQAPQELR